MRPTFPSLGAMRLPLNTKRGNKDFYKGTKQAYIPGTNVRTGRPGRFPSSRKALFEVDDTKVRFFVAPPAGLLEKTELKPYVAHSIDSYAYKQSLRAFTGTRRPLPWELVKEYKGPDTLPEPVEYDPQPTGLPVTPPISPLPLSMSREELLAIPEYEEHRAQRLAELETGDVDRRAGRTGWSRVEKTSLRTRDFAKRYRNLDAREKEALKWQARREWYEGQRKFIEVLKKNREEDRKREEQEVFVPAPASGPAPAGA